MFGVGKDWLEWSDICLQLYPFRLRKGNCVSCLKLFPGLKTLGADGIIAVTVMQFGDITFDNCQWQNRNDLLW